MVGALVRTVDTCRGRQARRPGGFRQAHERGGAGSRGYAQLNAAALIAAAAAEFTAAGLHFGHGTDNAEDEALFLVLHALGWSYATADEQLQRPLAAREVDAALALIRERIDSRRPAAYLTRRMWFAGHEFYVDDRVLVPRSPIAELIAERFEPWLGGEPVLRALDIGTGSGCIAIALAHAFTDARVDATDISADALEVARHNRRSHGLEARLELYAADLFPPTPARYQLIVSNPPYVPVAVMDGLPAEYRAEPPAALVAGAQGFDCVDRILRAAAAWLAPGGLLVVEVGEIWPELEAHYPGLPFTWVEFEHGGEGVFVLTREVLAAYR